MASINKNAIGSDDEDDLESLRLAALQSLKPKTTSIAPSKPVNVANDRVQNVFKPHSTFGAAQTTRYHNRSFRNNAGRMGRNGLNSRNRGNPNLISIQVIDENESKDHQPLNPACINTTSDVPKLILPQDRYHKTPEFEISKEKESSGNKFDRYDDNSEESESDSDELPLKPKRRERKNSLDALIDDIDNILEGKDEKTENKESIDKLKPDESDDKNDDLQKETSDTLIIQDADPDLVQIIQEVDVSPSKSDLNEKERSNSRSPYNKCKSRSTSRSKSIKSRSRSPFNNKVKSPYRSPRRSRSRSRSPIPRKRYSPLPYAHSLSQLTLNTDVLNTITMAPLSPRSAAFVLENRTILARRQMSPRRSRSPRSRDSSLRRSISPKRVKLSPRRRSRSRSRSPIFDPIRKCSLSPRKRSNSPKFSPKRRSNSPRNYSRRSPNFNRLKNHLNSSNPVKPSVHKRLGVKNDRKSEPIPKRKRASRSLSLSLSPSPDRNYHKRPLNETTGLVNERRRNQDKNKKDSPSVSQKDQPKEIKEDKTLDPVLEARKKKFESPVQLGKNNGIIKLKSSKQDTLIQDDKKSDEDEKDKEILKIHEDNLEDEFLNEGSGDEIELNPSIDDLWSDEESDNENEGRFKSKSNTNKKTVPTISIRKLTEKSVPIEPLLSRDTRNNTVTYRSTSDKTRNVKRSKYNNRRSRSPVSRNTTKTESFKTSSHRDKKESIKSKIRSETKDKSEKTIRDKVDKTKETNIENVENQEVLKTIDLSEDKSNKRKVKIHVESEAAAPDLNIENNDEPEIIIETEDESVVTPNNDDGGDLRTELSRRRAQRLQKAGSLVNALPARLLKSALKEVVPKRPASKLSKVIKGDANSNSGDRKVLILKRLASSPISQLEPANKVSQKESGKLPIHMRLGQSNVTADVFMDEGTTRERRPKKSRSGKRKNKQAVQV